MTGARWLFESRARRLWRLLLAVGVATASWFAFVPIDSADAVEHLDKVRHVMAFASLALAAALSWAPGRRTTGLITAGLMAYGLFIELVQTQLPTRSGSVADVLADALGLALGLLLARGLRPRA